MRKHYSRARPHFRRTILFLSLSTCFAGLLLFGSITVRAENTPSAQYINGQVIIAQVDIRPGQSYVIKPKGPSQKELKEAAELAHKRRLATAAQSTRYDVATKDGRMIDCKTITRDKNTFSLTTLTGKIITVQEQEIKEITKLQYYNGRLKKTVLESLSDIPETAETTTE